MGQARSGSIVKDGAHEPLVTRAEFDAAQSVTKSLLTPRVKVFFSARSRVPIPTEVIDLAKLVGRDKIVGRESAEEWGFRHIEELWSGLEAPRGSYFG